MTGGRAPRAMEREETGHIGQPPDITQLDPEGKQFPAEEFDIRMTEDALAEAEVGINNAGTVGELTELLGVVPTAEELQAAGIDQKDWRQILGLEKYKIIGVPVIMTLIYFGVTTIVPLAVLCEQCLKAPKNEQITFLSVLAHQLPAYLAWMTASLLVYLGVNYRKYKKEQKTD